jgi:hypothetical protein
VYKLQPTIQTQDKRMIEPRRNYHFLRFLGLPASKAPGKPARLRHITDVFKAIIPKKISIIAAIRIFINSSYANKLTHRIADDHNSVNNSAKTKIGHSYECPIKVGGILLVQN